MPLLDLDKYTQQMFVKYFSEAAFPLFVLAPPASQELKSVQSSQHRASPADVVRRTSRGSRAASLISPLGQKSRPKNAAVLAAKTCPLRYNTTTQINNTFTHNFIEFISIPGGIRLYRNPA